jgi:uncharacterized phage protein (TIGR02216 family)
VKPAALPWDRIIGYGLGVLRLSPSAFWKMTPREFALAVEAVTGGMAGAIDRHDFAALMRSFPDAAPRTPSEDHDHG